jgi:hypothetical protein
MDGFRHPAICGKPRANRGVVHRRRLERLELSQRGLVERQRLLDVGIDLRVRAGLDDRLGGCRVCRADRIGVFDEVGV